MTQYLLAIHRDGLPPKSPAEFRQSFKDVEAFCDELRAAGAWVFQGGLRADATPKVVRISDGTVVTTDGPFAETKEQLGGFWIVEAADLDAALGWAAKASASCGHPIEVRPFEKDEEGCEVDIMNEVGTLHRLAGDLELATGYYREAVDMARETADSRGEAHALAGLGRCAVAAGDLSGARDLLGQSRQIFEQIGAADAVDVAAELGDQT